MHAIDYEMQETSCPLCNSQDCTFFCSTSDRLNVADELFTFVRCNQCNLVYQNPRVTPETINVFYPSHYFSSRPGRNVRHQKRAERIVQKKCDIIESYTTQPGSLLEIGSANGDFLASLQKQGWDVQGIEVSPDAVEYSRTQYGLNVFQGEFLERPDDGTRFDIIVMWAVLPHIHNPVPTVARASELLASNGKLIILCANIESLAAERMGNEWGHLDLPRHYCMWSPDTLRTLYEKSGLRIDDIMHHDDIYNSGLILRWFKPILYSTVHGPAGFPTKLLRYAVHHLNQVLTKPILAKARMQNRGGIVTVVGSKPGK